MFIRKLPFFLFFLITFPFLLAVETSAEDRPVPFFPGATTDINSFSGSVKAGLPAFYGPRPGEKNPSDVINGRERSWTVYTIVGGIKVKEAYDFYKEWVKSTGGRVANSDDGYRDVQGYCQAPSGHFNAQVGTGLEAGIVNFDISGHKGPPCSGFLENTKIRIMYSTNNYDSNRVSPVGTSDEIVTTDSVPPTKSPPPETENCTIPYEELSQRQEIINDINTRFRLQIKDSNICSLNSCVANKPFSMEQLTGIKDTLDALPACFVNKLNLKGINGLRQGDADDPLTTLGEQVNDGLCCSKSEPSGGCGYGQYWGLGYNRITYCGNKYQSPPSQCKTTYTFKGILVHEMAHAFQFQNQEIKPLVYNTPLVSLFEGKTGWRCFPLAGCEYQGLEPPPSSYAIKEKDPLEDMAESARVYFEDPARLKSQSPSRYNFVKSNLMCGTEFIQ